MLRRILIAPIRLYQRFLSPLKPIPTCRFLPTCSSYAIESIERRGVIVGSLKALGRLLRCNPLFPGGYDPVVPPALQAASQPVVEPGSEASSGSRHQANRANCDQCESHTRGPARALSHESLDIESVRI